MQDTTVMYLRGRESSIHAVAIVLEKRTVEVPLRALLMLSSSPLLCVRLPRVILLTQL